MTITDYARQLADTIEYANALGFGRTQTRVELSALTIFWDDGGFTGVQVRREIDADSSEAEPLATAIERCLRATIEDEDARPVLVRYRLQVDTNGGAMLSHGPHAVSE